MDLETIFLLGEVNMVSLRLLYATESDVLLQICDKINYKSKNEKYCKISLSSYTIIRRKSEIIVNVGAYKKYIYK